MARRKKRDNTSGVHHAQDKRVQYQIRFNLNLLNDIEALLADDIAALKESRLFRGSIINALKLFFNLMNGLDGELRKQFPGIVKGIEQAYANEEIRALRREIEELKAQGYSMPTAPHTSAKAASLALPAVTKKAAAKVDIAKNFAASTGGFFD